MWVPDREFYVAVYDVVTPSPFYFLSAKLAELCAAPIMNEMGRDQYDATPQGTLSVCI